VKLMIITQMLGLSKARDDSRTNRQLFGDLLNYQQDNYHVDLSRPLRQLPLLPLVRHLNCLNLDLQL
jgi:hypothetical protein